MNTLIFLAQGAPASPPNAFVQLLPMIVLLAAMYFLLFAPQRKKQKEHQKLLTEIKVGDKVITNAGIFGAITSVKEDRFVLQIADNTKIEIAKPSIQGRSDS